MTSFRLLILAFLTAGLQSALAQSDLDSRVVELLRASRDERPAALRALLEARPPVADFVAAARRARAPRAPDLDAGWSLHEAEDSRGIVRPYQLFLPEELRKAPEGLPLLVCLHGAVGRAQFSRTLGRVGATGAAWSRAAAKRGFPVLYPLARRDCVWWSEAGVRAIRAALRDAQRKLPIDPARVVVSGFSDGGSGCFYLAMKAPDPFAAFIPLNGHPRVASAASGESLHLRNALGASLFVAMTRDDVLYPARDVMPHLQPLLANDADLHLVVYPKGNHTPAYFTEQEEALCRFFLEARYDPWPERIDWSQSGEGPGGRAWLEITHVGPTTGDRRPRDDFNLMSTPGRIRLGVRLATDVAEPTIESVTEDSLAASLELRKGDRLRALDGRALRDAPSLRAALAKKKHGEPILVTMERGAGRGPTTAAFPPSCPGPSTGATAPRPGPRSSSMRRGASA